ncbi:hypothetical protein N9850_14515 [Granulosicoccus sp.]|nr:hypothetical protein [Granulosicoccus sp.]MDB4224975.1 hypothetical protein [Granulosicoccus sp.]
MKIVLVTLFFLVLTACASNPSSTEPSKIDATIAAGGEEIERGMLDIIGDTGATLVAVNGVWRSYLGPNGRIATQIVEDNSIKELSWRVNDAGVWCQISYTTGQEECRTDIRIIKSTNHTYFYFLGNDLQEGTTFKVEGGNPYSL